MSERAGAALACGRYPILIAVIAWLLSEPLPDLWAPSAHLHVDRLLPSSSHPAQAMTEPPGKSLRSLGLTALDGSRVPKAATTTSWSPELIIAAANNGGTVRCQKCDGDIELRSLTAL